VPEGADANLTEDVSYGESQVDKMTYDQIVEEFRKFPEDVRKVFKLFYVDNLKCDEISAITGMPIGTIKSHLSRKRKILKQKFNK
jgi:RNA polymerase sigma-70 factor (ECF subfamily)